MTPPIRILLVDDSPHFLEAARDYLGYQEALTVVGTASEGREALAQTQALQPDIILLDLNLSQSSGLNLIPVLKQNLPDTKIIVLTMMEESSYRAAALEAGADGFVQKSTMSKTLASTILDAMESAGKGAEKAGEESVSTQQEEARLMRLAEHLPDLIYRYEFKPRRGFTYVSPSATTMTGYTPQDHYNDPDLGLKLVLPQDRHILEEAAQGRADPLRPIVLRWVRRDGRVIWTEQRNVSIFDENGELVAIEGIARDITEQKQAESALRISEASLRESQAVSHVGHWTWDTENNQVEWSDEMKRIFGLDPETFSGNLAEIIARAIHPDDQAIVNAANQAVLDKQKPVPLEYRLVLPNGSVRTVLAIPGKNITTPDGRITKLTGIVQDITDRKQAEEKLRESEARYRQLFESNPHPMWVYDMETLRFLAVNDAAISQYGFSREEFSSMTLKDIRPEEEIPGLLENIMNNNSTLQSTSGWRHRLKDGRLIDVEITSHALKFEGRSARLVLANNITERRLAETALKVSEENYRSLAETTDSAIAVVDRNGRILYANPASLRIWDDPGLIGKSVSDLFPQKLARRYRSIVRHVIDRRIVHLNELETRVTGRSMWFRVSMSPLKNSDGTVNALLLNAWDMTDRKLAEEELRQSQERFRSYIEQANDFIFTLDPSGRITSANQAMCTTLGYSDSELMGRSALILVASEHQAEVARTLQRIWNGETIDEYEVPVQTSSGKTIIVQIRGRAIYKDAHLTETIHIARDVTFQRQAEEQLKRRVAELEALYQSGIAFNQTFDPKEIGENIIEVLSGRLNWHHAAVRVRRGESHEIDLLAFSHPSEGQSGEERIRSAITHVGQGLAGRVIESGKPYRTGDLNADPRYIPTYPGMRSGLYVPIQIFDRTLGCISVESDQKDAFTEEDERLLSTLAVQAAAALENARSYQAALMSARRLGVLYEAGQELVRATQNIEELYVSVHNAVSQLMPAEAFTIALRNEDQGLLEGVYLFDKSGRWHAEPVPFGEGFSSKVIVSGKTMLIRDLQDVSIDVVRFGTEESVRSVLAVPLRSGEKVFGALSTQSYRPDSYTEDDRYLLEMLAAQIATALVNARLFRDLQGELSERILAEERIQNQLDRLNALRTIDQAITSTFDMRVSLEVILSQTLKLLSVDAAAVLLFNPVANTLQYASGQGFQTGLPVDVPVKLDQSYAGMAVLERRMIKVPDLAGRPANIFHGEFVKAEGVTSYHCTPLVVKGNVLGVLEVFDRTVTERNEDWLDFLNTLAGQAALAIDNAQLFSASRRELAERKKAQEELLKLNAELEARVASRTVDLSRVNTELEHALRVKDEFLANMSHELRTPLNAIIGLSESLDEQNVGPLNEKQEKYIGTIHESGEHLLELINDILDLAKIESGKGSLNREVVDVRTVCQASLRMVNQLALKRNHQITFEMDEHFETILADERRLKQMLVNLLSNAVKFTPENGRISLEVRRDPEENTAIFTVRDTGIGIKQEDLPRLFNPFVQLDSDLSRRTSGTGLGLALVAQMARMHGGSVGVDSRPGKGSRFFITLPLESAREANISSKRRTTGSLGKMTPRKGRKHTLLLVEDTQEVVMVVRDFLEFEGFRVEVAKNGIEGLALAKKIHPDLILMDVQMPEMDGLEATRRLRMEAGFGNTPIIALTALAMSGDRERCLAAGMDEYLSKPISLKSMIKMIRKFMPADGEKPTA